LGVQDGVDAPRGGRYSSQFIETKFDDDYFTLHHLTHMSD
jgi:hypothetical protein